MSRGCATEYAGVVFRSRLEAEWAWWLTGRGLAWVYEPAVIRLAGGARYTPDFVLVESQVWVEVKPGVPSSLEFAKATEATRVLGPNVWFFCGHPQRPTFWGPVPVGVGWGFEARGFS